jgi:hypothetical protein
MNYTDFANQTVSEKIGLVILEASERLIGWTLHSGTVYKFQNFQRSNVWALNEADTQLEEGSSIASLTPGQYYFDRSNEIVYLKTTDETHPNGKFIALTFRLFFSTPNGIITLPHDLSAGYEVEWLPLIQDTSDFGVDLDNQNQLGVAIEGSGTIKLINDKDFWSSLYDKVYFENQTCLVYSWTRGLPATEAKILFRGKVQSKTYSDKSVSLSLKDSQNALRAPVPIANLEDYPGARIPKALETAKQRRVYGYVYGHRPTNIDAVLEGYPLGNATVTNQSAIVTTAFNCLEKTSPGDELIFVSPIGNTKYAIATVDASNQVTLTSVYGGASLVNTGCYIKPKYPKRYTNRIFLVAGHATKEPLHEISEFVSSVNRIRLDSVDDFLPGEEIIVGSELVTIRRIVGNEIKLASNLSAPPIVGTQVRRPSITNVRLNEKVLIVDRDYTYDPATALLTLATTAEFEVASVVSIPGTLTFSAGSYTVSGSGTSFNDLRPGDWVRSAGFSDFFEIRSIESDTSLTLVAQYPYNLTTGGYAKQPDIYIDDQKSFLTCDILGATEDGTTNGVFLKTAPQITRDILINVGLGDIIEETSFSTAKYLAPQKIGLVIPTKFSDRNTPKLKDVINSINKSVFGSVIQTNDFLLAYHVFRPVRETNLTRYTESDILKYTIKSLSDKISKTAIVRYLNREYEPVSQSAVFSQATKQSDIATYLGKTPNETIIETLLVDDTEARHMANRWAFLIGQASTVIQFQTKMQGTLLNVTDRLEISHEQFYERVGSRKTRKISALQSSRKSFNDVTIETEDLSNAFSRCAIITENDASNYDNSTDDEAFYNSFITDTYGMQDNDPDTFGINLIW